MTISSSLNAGVAGLNANASRLATISDNIANSATYGYRRATTDFQSMVMTSTSKSSYTAGGVRATNMRMIDSQGPLINTSNATDLTVDGRGFLAVTSIGALEKPVGGYPISLVSTGSFRPDADGILRTVTGQVLMGWPDAQLGPVHVFPRDTLASLQPVRVNANQFVGNATTELGISINLPSSSVAATSTADPNQLAIEYHGNLGSSESLDFLFTPSTDPLGPPNTWTMTIRDSASNNAVIGEYMLSFNASQVNGGTLESVTTISGQNYDLLTGTIPLTVGAGSINLDIGVPGKIDGMTQLDTIFTPVSIAKNGSPVASMTSIEVNEKGELFAIYDQGFTRRLYQIPVVDVPNPNGLRALNNQSYQIAVDSGPIYLWDAGDGPTGSVLGFTREESSVDVAQELTQLIQTQRAYSSNAKVIQTVDEMLQETNGIKR